MRASCKQVNERLAKADNINQKNTRARKKNYEWRRQEWFAQIVFV